MGGKGRQIRIAVALDPEGFWCARGHAGAGDEEVAQAAADELADVAETFFMDLHLPETEAPVPARQSIA
ncbi:MAG TPA: hypothetical protein VK837_08250 [Longimicrobiales bacterium]|nr:hypothetical protein [Longimicrobiales bacterium]